MIRMAINGYGRIGRNILRACYERPALREKLQIVAINDLGDVAINAHLTRYDSVHGHFSLPVDNDQDSLIIDGDPIRVLSEPDPSRLPWRELGVDVVCECTGRFTHRASASAHLHAGAGKVLLSAPGKDVDATIVYGVNSGVLKSNDRIVSNGSCTTNCLAPLAQVLHRAVGIESGFMTTVHSYTNDQQLSDLYHPDVYRARSATQSMIPTKTGAASALGLVLPELAGRLDGLAVRVPTINVSLLDLNFLASKDTSIDEINGAMCTAAATDTGNGVLTCSEAPLVSIDFNHSPYSCHFDLNHTRVNGRMVKVMAWYDNEWGFSNRMLDNCLAMMQL